MESSATSNPHHNAEAVVTCPPGAEDRSSALPQGEPHSSGESPDSNAIALEALLKNTLQQLGVLVGKQVDIQNLDKVLQERLDDLVTLRKAQENENTKTKAEICSGDAVKTDSNDQESAQISNVADPSASDDPKDQTDRNECQEPLKEADVRAKSVSEAVGILVVLEDTLSALIADRDLFATPVESAKTGAQLGLRQSTNALWELIQPLSRMAIAYPQLRTRFTTISSILVIRHIPDLYAALLQLAYRPLPKPKTPVAASGENDGPQTSGLLSPTQPSSLPAKPAPKLTPGNLTGRGSWSNPQDTPATASSAEPSHPSSPGVTLEQSQERQRQLHQKEESAKLFYDLFWNTEAARSLESLTILLNSGSSLHPVPTWLKSASGRFLSQILLRPGGVRVVLEYMLGIGGGTPDGGGTVKLDQLEKVSRLVTSVPDQISSVQEKRMTPPSPQLVQAATFVVGKILLKAPTLGHYEIVVKEVEPLWRWGTRANILKENQDTASSPESVIPKVSAITLGSAPNKKKVTIIETHDEDGNDDEDEAVMMDPLVASEYELSKAVLFLHKFLVGNEPSPPLFDAFLAQSAQALYRLYEYTTQTRSVLKDLAKEILVVYMRILEPQETVEVLKSIVMRRRMHIPQSKPWQGRIALPSESKGSGGTILPLLEMGSAREAYFAPGPTGGVVLRRRRDADREAATQLELDVDAFLDILNEVEASGQGEITGDLYMYLLDEYQAGKARGSISVSPRRMLTMLQLILSMTQKLGPSILSKVTQIIGLANNILEHQVSPEKDKDHGTDGNGHDNAEDEDEDGADMEILGLVLTLLTAILNENEHLSQQDRHLLALTLVHLKQLSDHPFLEIRRVAHDLQMLIPPRLKESSNGSDKAPKKTEMEIEMEKYASALAALQDGLLPVRAHGLHILREMILEKSIALSGGHGSSERGQQSRELDHALDIFVQHVQELDSFIYLNAVKGLAALTDAHGPEILRKLMRIYSNEDGKQKLDTRLRIGEALVQTVQRCGEALGAYTDALLPGLYKVMNTKMDELTIAMRAEVALKRKEKVDEKRRSDALLTVEEKQVKWKAEMARRNRMERRKQGLATEDVEGDFEGEEMQDADEEDVVDEVSLLRSSALTILATAIEVCPLAILPELRFLLDWILSILDLDPQIEVRRGAMLVIVLLLRALEGNALYRIEGDQLKRVYRTLRYVEEVDQDQLCRAQARAGIADLDAIVRMEMNPSQESGHPWTTEISSSGNKLGDIRFR
ncbi:hypothetical protein BGW38_002220 [Lunasporangiospora selenospora]|uniref:Uncharacterized protein n=1 Tax=Lunasporangiospora selenospora TaxID=979761 RepID=A0A9P6FT50_9FUNG|nr:hypothetical protein BGW38_002220 [Lunasporangiospora selenospora]